MMPETPPPAMPYRPTSKRGFFAKPWVRVLLVLVAAAAGWHFFGKSGGKDAGAMPPVRVHTAAVLQQVLPVTIHGVGNVVAYESVAIRARLDSQVVAVHFKDGEEVKKGDLLFELDDKALRAQAAELAANIARDKATLENARRQSSRAATLAEKGFATKATRDDTDAAVAVAQASLSASEAALQNVNVQLGYTRIVAPITGRTGTINVTLGNNVKANDPQPLVTINQLKPIRVQAALPQLHFDALRTAMQSGAVTAKAALKDDATNATIAEGKLDYIDNSVDAATGTFVTRAGFENADERLLPGMFVTMTLSLGGASEVLTVPEVAVQHGQEGDFVFVISGEEAKKQPVTVARMQDNLAVIASGLTPGIVVATDGILGLTDGAKVTVTSEAAAAPAAAAPTPEPTKAN